MQMLEAPARFHELDGQPVQQRVVLGPGRPQAEVVHGADERLAEMPGPDVVDRDARRQGVPAVDDPAGQREAPAGADLCVRGVARRVAIGRLGAGKFERARRVLGRERRFRGCLGLGVLPFRGGEPAARLDERRGGLRAGVLEGIAFLVAGRRRAGRRGCAGRG